MKRTEREILNDFIKLGWMVVYNDCYIGIKFRKFSEMLDSSKSSICIYDTVLEISKLNHWYSCYVYNESTKLSVPIDMQEHQLLHELFICWGWL